MPGVFVINDRVRMEPWMTACYMASKGLNAAAGTTPFGE